jgi:hypothetical protein
LIYGRDDVVLDFVKKVAHTDMDFTFARACGAGVDDAIAKVASKS